MSSICWNILHKYSAENGVRSEFHGAFRTSEIVFILILDLREFGEIVTKSSAKLWIRKYWTWYRILL